MYVAVRTINYRFSFTEKREKWNVKEKARKDLFILHFFKITYIVFANTSSKIRKHFLFNVLYMCLRPFSTPFYLLISICQGPNQSKRAQEKDK